jgi:ribosomal protein L11 methyltransferase
MLFIISPLMCASSTVDIDQIAFEEHACLGKIDYALDEPAIDKLLGEKAYCGGELPEGVFDIIEKDQEEKSFGRYFWESEKEADGFALELKKLGIDSKKNIEEKKDWNESWRKEFKTIVVSDSLKVVPSWEKVEGKDTPSELYIYPGMGFGTGNHETTFLCLKLYEKAREIVKVEKVLDFGCGSGILGIAAIKKDLASVDFVDIDADALDNCLQNLNFNSYEDYSTDHSLVLRDRFAADLEYDLVFANILENVLELEHSLLRDTTKDDGLLIVSGLLKGQEQSIEKVYEEFSLLDTVIKGDWVALLFKKKSN